MTSIRIEPFRPEMVAEASKVLADAFSTNPLHVAAFGAGEIAKNSEFFRNALVYLKGPRFVALEGSHILGLVHWVDSSSCQFSTIEKLRMVPAMVRGLGLSSSARVGRWLDAWSKRDPSSAHSHFGPIGISPPAQGRGIGQLLMKRYCDELDRSGQAAYLETDRPENVQYYRRFGFETSAEGVVLGVRNYFMWRPPG
jgi:hypothetical protein